MRKAYINLIIILSLAVVLCCSGYFVYKYFKYQKEAVPAAVEISKIEREASMEATEEAGTQEAAKNLPEELNLEMTFYPQAPFGNWDLPWQEACEEASSLLVANEYLGKNWSRDQFNDEILNLVEWEKKTFGDYKHTTVRQTAKILNDYLGLKTLIYDNPSFEDIEKIINRGHLIVVPFAGKLLGNPFYKNGGPVYHMMVIKGYKINQRIITSDVGTRNGEDYVYSWVTIEYAMHDYATPIEDGAKRIIEVIPPGL